jgi:hypothetical protein
MTLIENFFAKLKKFRAIAIRYDKTARNLLAGVHLTASARLAQLTTGPSSKQHYARKNHITSGFEAKNPKLSCIKRDNQFPIMEANENIGTGVSFSTIDLRIPKVLIGSLSRLRPQCAFRHDVPEKG